MLLAVQLHVKLVSYVTRKLRVRYVEHTVRNKLCMTENQEALRRNFPFVIIFIGIIQAAEYHTNNN